MRKIVLFGLFVLFLFSTAPVLAQLSTISGAVVDAADGVTPVHPVAVRLINPVTGADLGGVTNNPDGSYEISGVTPGEYKFLFNTFDAANHYIDELYDEITPCYNGGCDRANLGNTINIVSGANVLNEDLKVGATLSGRIVDTGDGVTPVHPVVISFIDPWTGAAVGGATNNLDGTYSTGAVPPGQYFFLFSAVDAANHYIDEVWDEIECDNGGCDLGNIGGLLYLGAGNLILDEDLLDPANPGGSISGFVKDATTGIGISSMWMVLLDENCEGIVGVYTEAGASLGEYAINGVPDGTYYMATDDRYQGYINKIYPNEQRMKPCAGAFPVGQAIVIENQNQVDNIDFELDAGGTITGAISDSNGEITDYQAYVRLYDAGGVLIGTYFGDGDPGVTYVVDGLMPGDYQVLFTSVDMGLIDERYDDEPCPRNSCDPLLGDLVSVGLSEHVTGISGELAPGAIIRGRVTDALTGEGVSYYRLAIYNAEGIYAGTGRANEDGYYETSTGFPDGNYYLSNQFPSHLTTDTEGYLLQVWTNDGSYGDCGEPCDVTLGDAITVNGLSPVENVNIVLYAAPGVSLEKHTNGVDADTPDGGDTLEIAIGGVVSWTYTVTNTGGFDLEDILVIDNPAVAIDCPATSLTVGLAMTCTATGVAQDLSGSSVIGNCSGRANSKLFQNIATVTAQTSDIVSVMDEDMSHYCNPDSPASNLIFESGFEQQPGEAT